MSALYVTSEPALLEPAEGVVALGIVKTCPPPPCTNEENEVSTVFSHTICLSIEARTASDNIAFLLTVDVEIVTLAIIYLSYSADCYF